MPRCEKYDHQVTVEAVDGADWNQDVNIYFPSSRLEVYLTCCCSLVFILLLYVYR